MIIDPGESGEVDFDDIDVDVDGDDGGDQGGDDDTDADDDGDDDEDLTEDEEAEYQATMKKLREDDDVKKKTPEKKPPVKAKSDKQGDEGKGEEEGSPSNDSKEEGKKGDGELHTIKVNGVEKQLTTQQLIAEAQKANSSEERYQQGSTMRKQAEGLVKMMQEDPMAVLSKLNVPPEKIEQWLYDNHIAPSILEGDEKEQWERNRELTGLREKEAQRDAQDKRARQEQTRQAWSTKIDGAIKSAPGLPQTDWSVNRVAQYMQRAIKGGFRDITPEEVIPYVLNDWKQINTSHLGSLDDDQLMDHLGEEGVEKVRKALLKKHGATKRKPRRTSSGGAKKRGQRIPRSPNDMITMR